MDKPYQHPIYLICNNCKQKVETGITFVTEHTFTCTVYDDTPVLDSEGNETGFILRHRPKITFTSIYQNNDNSIANK